MIVLLGQVALLMTLFVYFAFIKLLRLPFTPAYSAFTFPLVIGATALFKTTDALLENGFNTQVVQIIERLANVELMIATLMVGYVSLRYIVHFSPTKKRLIN